MNAAREDAASDDASHDGLREDEGPGSCGLPPTLAELRRIHGVAQQALLARHSRGAASATGSISDDNDVYSDTSRSRSD